MSEFPEVLSITTYFTVNSDVTEHLFRAEVNADGGIAPNCIRIGRLDDDVTCIFDAALSTGERTTLEGLANVHTPYSAYNIPNLLVDPTDGILRSRLDDETMIRVSMQNPSEVHISATPGVGQYSTLAAAVAAFIADQVHSS